MIGLRGVAHRAGAFRLGPLDLELATGEYFVLLGSTGSGKTTLLELVAGARRADAGRLFLHGRDATRVPPEERRVGWAAQDGLLFPHLTVSRNIAFGLQDAAAERGRRVAELARAFALESFLERFPRELSGGERRRVALARALAPRPRVLLLDEPLGSSDPEMGRRLRGELRRAHEALGATTVHVAHDPEEARALADRVGLLRDGRLMRVGAPAEALSGRSAGALGTDA